MAIYPSLLQHCVVVRAYSECMSSVLCDQSYFLLHTQLWLLRENSSNIVHGILSAAVLLIVVVCGSVICALAVKVHRLRKYSKSDKCGLTLCAQCWKNI